MFGNLRKQKRREGGWKEAEEEEEGSPSPPLLHPRSLNNLDESGYTHSHRHTNRETGWRLHLNTSSCVTA